MPLTKNTLSVLNDISSSMQLTTTGNIAEYMKTVHPSRENENPKYSKNSNLNCTRVRMLTKKNISPPIPTFRV